MAVFFQCALLILMAIISYHAFYMSGLILAVHVITGLIILNGWISSRGHKPYSDLLFATDVFILCLYIFLIMTLYASENQLDARYWLASSLICALYAIWDWAVKYLVGDSVWKGMFRKYMRWMIVSSVGFAGLYILANTRASHSSVIILMGIALWIIILGKWLYDRIQLTNKSLKSGSN